MTVRQAVHAPVRDNWNCFRRADHAKCVTTTHPARPQARSVGSIAIYAFLAAGLEGVRAFSSAKAGPVIGHLLLALVDVAAGVIALVWPGPTALVLVLIVAVWAVAGGVAEIFAGFAAGETAGTRALFFVTGLVSIAFGVVLFAHPNIGAFTIALLFGLYSLVYGVSEIVMGIEARQTGKHLQSVVHHAA
jgi:uncharacterized membrane protein HdeD (DUF308 family)